MLLSPSMPRARMEPQETPEDEAEAPHQRVEWPIGDLALRWEREDAIRARGRTLKGLTRWTSPKTKGIANMQAISLNAEALYHLAVMWCPLVQQAKTPPVELLKHEAALGSTVLWGFWGWAILLNFVV